MSILKMTLVLVLFFERFSLDVGTAGLLNSCAFLGEDAISRV